MARKAVEIDPTSSQAYLALASAHSLLGRSSESLNAIRRAVELEPNDPDALGSLADGLANVGRFDEALPPALKLMRVEPGELNNSLRVAMLYMDLGMYDEAEAWCRAELAQRPEGGTIYAVLAEVEFARGDMEGAEQALDTALAVSPGDYVVILTRFLYQARRGDFVHARESGERLAENAPEMAVGGVILGYVYESLGDSQHATAIYREKRRINRLLLEGGSDDWWPRMEMAQLEILNGDRVEAIRLLNEAYDRGMGSLSIVRLDPVLALMEGDPGYARWVARIEADVARMRERVRAAERRAQG
jgi:tetratricopeptide (TPR) repeat protein